MTGKAIPKWCRAARRIKYSSIPPVAWRHPRRYSLGAQQISAGDVLLVSGTLGDHGATILNLREQLGLDGALSSDCAVLTPLSQTLREIPDIKALRDATRGGVNVRRTSSPPPAAAVSNCMKRSCGQRHGARRLRTAGAGRPEFRQRR